METSITPQFEEAGEKVVKMDEMADSAHMADFLAKCNTHLQMQVSPDCSKSVVWRRVHCRLQHVGLR